MANSTHNAFFNALSLDKLSDLLFTRQTPIGNAATHCSLRQRIVDWRQRNAAAAELSQLSDRELADIGISRSQISEVVKGK